MRLLFLVLLLLVGLIQYPLWQGKGGWFKVWDLQKQVARQHETNDSMRARNAALRAEVKSLASGTEAIEERARGELGMMREGEVFVNILPPGVAIPGASGATTPGSATSAAGAVRPPTAGNPPAARSGQTQAPAARPAQPNPQPRR